MDAYSVIFGGHDPLSNPVDVDVFGGFSGDKEIMSAILCSRFGGFKRGRDFRVYN